MCIAPTEEFRVLAIELQ